METQKLTVRLPVDDIAYLKGYARDRGITVTEALRRYLHRLRELEHGGIHPEVAAVSGLVSAQVDAQAVFAEHLDRKHR